MSHFYLHAPSCCSEPDGEIMATFFGWGHLPPPPPTLHCPKKMANRLFLGGGEWGFTMRLFFCHPPPPLSFLIHTHRCREFFAVVKSRRVRPPSHPLPTNYPLPPSHPTPTRPPPPADRLRRLRLCHLGGWVYPTNIGTTRATLTATPLVLISDGR